MRVFCASLATETNTFSPLRTDFSDFAQSFYAPPGEHPDTPTLCSAVFPALRRRAKEEGFTLIEGTATWAEPGGLVSAATWEHLRDEVLSQLKAALPVDAVVLGLHGAMIADGCVDCGVPGKLRMMTIIGRPCVDFSLAFEMLQQFPTSTNTSASLTGHGGATGHRTTRGGRGNCSRDPN